MIFALDGIEKKGVASFFSIIFVLIVFETLYMNDDITSMKYQKNV
jgi:hypothetical protein